MPKTYRPLPVLPAFTDEALRNPAGPYRNIAAALLTVPAEYRQAALAELARRTSTLDAVEVDTPGGIALMSMLKPRVERGSGNTLDAVVREIRQQLGLTST